MKQLKRVTLLLLCLSVLLFGCGKKNSSEQNNKTSKDVTVRVGSLKGPTTMGLVKLMKDAEAGVAKGDYTFTMETQADVIIGLVSKGELDIALVPANVASVLYNKTEGAISVIDINTLGVLYFVGADDSIKSINDLSGRTIYLTGKGQTPDYVLQYLLEENGIKDVKLEYKSEATEVASVLAKDNNAIGFIPQPFVTAVLSKNENAKILLAANDEWEKLQGDNGSKLVTGVTIVRNDFLNEYPDAVKTFMDEHKASAKFANDDVDTTATYVEEYGIVEKAPVAKKAMPYCNITYIEGDELQDALSGYLSVLYNIDPASVGGKLPSDNFYYSR